MWFVHPLLITHLVPQMNKPTKKLNLWFYVRNQSWVL
jgi:hypothetical protein